MDQTESPVGSFLQNCTYAWRYLAGLLTVLTFCGCTTNPPESSTTSAQPSVVSQSALSAPKPLIEPAADNAAPASEMRFTPIADTQFPELVPRRGEEFGYATILESLGSGAAAADIDRDGLPDALIAGGGTFEGRRPVGKPVFVLRNRGNHFSDHTPAAGLQNIQLYHHGLAVADADNDGFPDLLVTGYGGVLYFRNQGDGTFVDETTNSGIQCPTWCSSAAWADFNRDGCLDLYVAGYVDWSFENDPPCFAADGVTRDNCSPKLFNACPDFLFLSQADGTWLNQSAEWGAAVCGRGLEEEPASVISCQTRASHSRVIRHGADLKRFPL